MFLFLFRIFIILSLGLSGYILITKQEFFSVSPVNTLIGTFLGVLIGIILLIFERKLKQISLARFIWSAIGFSLGIGMARFFLIILHDIPSLEPLYASLNLLFSLIFGYIGLFLGYEHYESFSLPKIVRALQGSQEEKSFKILDTSVIIDGRIADICETGFIEGILVIPQFILKELQHIADSSDVLKRNRGRRGLDILQKIQKLADVDVQIVETDFPKVREVDAKLVELGKAIGGKILTNDFNLNKIAELQGIPVLNVNELANALKPVVLPGEVMNVHVLKEGKESGQGVAYLDDGTMVVVDNAIDAIGKDAEVSVTSVLQTTAGRMIFSRLKAILQ
ncbi:PIN/TRAM domain-containing protein [candidate division CSSED10-310 bacterium]|uniref:PIN/TRAM domain-containing protein n=1 Tax=candidate division CSSED10-310 bacterium TaxID=2855610 RepID=A0ABV6Z129_UNCC1